jgi:hypothetical protein
LGVFDRVPEYSHSASQGYQTQILEQTARADHEHARDHVNVHVDVHVLVDVVGFFLAVGTRSKLSL